MHVYTCSRAGIHRRVLELQGTDEGILASMPWVCLSTPLACFTHALLPPCLLRALWHFLPVATGRHELGCEKIAPSDTLTSLPARTIRCKAPAHQPSSDKGAGEVSASMASPAGAEPNKTANTTAAEFAASDFTSICPSCQAPVKQVFAPRLSSHIYSASACRQPHEQTYRVYISCLCGPHILTQTTRRAGKSARLARHRSITNNHLVHDF